MIVKQIFQKYIYSINVEKIKQIDRSKKFSILPLNPYKLIITLLKNSTWG